MSPFSRAHGKTVYHIRLLLKEKRHKSFDVQCLHVTCFNLQTECVMCYVIEYFSVQMKTVCRKVIQSCDNQRVLFN